MKPLQTLESARQAAHQCHDLRRYRWPVILLFYGGTSATVVGAIALVYCWRSIEV